MPWSAQKDRKKYGRLGIGASLANSRGMKFVGLVLVLAGCGVGETEGPIGDEFAVTRTRVAATPCPAFAQEQLQHTIFVEANDALLVDGHPAGESRIVPADADPKNGDTPNIVFTTREQWTSAQGNATPVVSYRLWTHDKTLTGTASAMFPFDTTTTATDCTFAWSVDGARLDAAP